MAHYEYLLQNVTIIILFDHKFSIADVAVGNAINGWVKSGLFLPALHPKLVFKKTLSCNIRSRHLMQSSSHSICCLCTLDAIQFAQHMLVHKYVYFTQHVLVRNAYIANRKTTYLLIPV